VRTADPKSWTPEPAGPSYVPVDGKTYSLFAGGLSTARYYEQIRGVTDEILRLLPDEETLLALIRKVGGKKRLLARAARRKDGTPISAILRLPHCLRDFRTECRSAPGDLDTVCVGCSETCFLHRVSTLLREAGIHPYIWRNAELGSLFRRLDDRGSIGVLGIACIPELAGGIRACMGRNVPVVGIPLDANRCARWMGRFEENSVNMERLRELLMG
jgi:hypothetical protein